jgi:hypothetical protein
VHATNSARIRELTAFVFEISQTDAFAKGMCLAVDDLPPMARLRGTGIVKRKDGTVVGEAPYDLTLEEHWIDPPNGGWVAWVLRGVIEINSWTIATLIVKHVQLELTLEDGRSLAFSFRTMNGSITPLSSLRSRRDDDST